MIFVDVKKIEILAPAGNLDILKTAVKNGADSVYFGAPDFNARRNAGNFSLDDISEGIDFCLARNKHAYLTLNTIVFDSEIKKAAKLISETAERGISAFIIQDLAVLELIKAICPDVKVHASTQMSTHSVSGCNALYDLGFDRAVLARELSEDEIIRITENTQIETEIFIHGALCMSVSGQCYFSSSLGERSGNRGLCAQVCRLPFSGSSPDSYALSLKDLSLISSIRDIEKTGAVCVKIEGRMKSEDYVRTACRAVYDARDGKTYDRKELEKIFSRNGFTDGYFRNRLGAEMFGTKSQEIYRPVSHEDSPDLSLTEISMNFSCRANQRAVLSIADSDGRTAVVYGDIPSEAKTAPLNEQGVIRQLSKLGDTPYTLGKTEITLDPDIYLSNSQLNEIRRSAASELTLSRTAKNTAAKAFRPKSSPSRAKRTKQQKIAVFKETSQLTPEVLDRLDFAFVPLFDTDKLDSRLLEYSEKLGAELPRIYFEDERRIINSLVQTKKLGISSALCHTLGKVRLAREAGFAVTGGFGLNISNSYASEALRNIGVQQIVLSPEVSLRNISQFTDIMPAGIICYGHLPVMISRNCPLRAESYCRKGKDCFLTDRKGEKHRLICSSSAAELYNSHPVWTADKQERLSSADFLVYLFTAESGDECLEILREYDKCSPKNNITRGANFREVL